MAGANEQTKLDEILQIKTKIMKLNEKKNQIKDLYDKKFKMNNLNEKIDVNDLDEKIKLKEDEVGVTVSIEYHHGILHNLVLAELQAAKKGDNKDDIKAKKAIFDAEKESWTQAAAEATKAQEEMNDLKTKRKDSVCV
ncbi:unnamed protein product [Rotaria sp. Silwood2]|nr:unnamed protein product [Rotaria sp. Silwood2]CAF4423788.1 unnamed protein product [Rotaria sp. Silwood2]